ncbi:MAG TPA: Na+/H+ antiporter NhaA [Puia sp.]|nr:Na+/H+ antiporter NhaA [Puia sp.]
MAGFSLTKIFREFFESERTGGLLLIGCTIASLLLANSPAGPGYIHFWHTHLDLSVANIPLDHSVEHWINDGLMAIFFLLVGLEIERELYIGELADFKKALLPMLAAAGGMLVPAATHYLFNHGTPAQPGIGIPMATDIAFALGILSLLGNKVPPSVKIFLTALAIIDDLGAILVIAVFYTKTISLLYLGAAFGILALLVILNKCKVTNLFFYLIPGVLVWYCMLRSGIHATISGVLLAFTIPFPKTLTRPGAQTPTPNPSEHLQHFLHKPVAFFILPVFALANTGIRLSEGWHQTLLTRNSLGIIGGLVLGKPAGILLFCLLAIKFKLCQLPGDMNRGHLAGLGILAGIGFTMSIFIANLAFDIPELIQDSKIAILAASLLASALGFVFLSRASSSGFPGSSFPGKS